MTSYSAKLRIKLFRRLLKPTVRCCGDGTVMVHASKVTVGAPNVPRSLCESLGTVSEETLCFTLLSVWAEWAGIVISKQHQAVA